MYDWAIRNDIQHGRYNGFRNTFDEWEARKERAADPLEPMIKDDEDELEQLRRQR
jgi:hypothetical protein